MSVRRYDKKKEEEERRRIRRKKKKEEEEERRRKKKKYNNEDKGVKNTVKRNSFLKIKILPKNRVNKNCM